ncbi:hypothetical protein [Actinokineospora enzanensis]|uniref:hypothetical protein n=1 Tax=Actinokineospora enzanensis TaxID=155975 RepID=UPI00036FD380|nr:hypothetical protein [Actinokineospora enzanensis]
MLVSVLLVSGCAGGDEPEGEPTLGTILVVTSGSGITLPLDSYRETPTQLATVDSARDILVRDCMAGFGFDWPTFRHEPDPDLGRRYGIIDRTEVSQYGYRVPPELQGGTNAPAPGLNETAASRAVLYGQGQAAGKPVPEGGCAAEADRQLGYQVKVLKDGYREVRDFVGELDQEGSAQHYADSRVAEANARWSECMKQAGYEYRTWRDANNDERFSQGAVAGPEELKVATADVDCKTRTNLPGVSLAVETAYQNRLIEKNAEALADVKRRLDDRVRHATELVSGGH